MTTKLIIILLSLALYTASGVCSVTTENCHGATFINPEIGTWGKEIKGYQMDIFEKGRNLFKAFFHDTEGNGHTGQYMKLENMSKNYVTEMLSEISPLGLEDFDLSPRDIGHAMLYSEEPRNQQNWASASLLVIKNSNDETIKKVVFQDMVFGICTK